MKMAKTSITLRPSRTTELAAMEPVLASRRLKYLSSLRLRMSHSQTQATIGKMAAMVPQN